MATLIGRALGLRSMIDYLMLAFVPITTAAAYQCYLILIRGQLRVHLEGIAKKQRLPMCLNCGYNHEGLISDTCPECGMPIRPAEAARPHDPHSSSSEA